MHQPNYLDRKSLQTQLENYKLIVDVNTDLAGKSLFAEDELAKKIELAHSYLNESDEWGKLGDQTRSNDALMNANMTIEQIGAVIKHVLKKDTPLDDSDLLSG
jgi:hypothetical protein